MKKFAIALSVVLTSMLPAGTTLASGDCQAEQLDYMYWSHRYASTGSTNDWINKMAALSALNNCNME